MLRSPVSVDNDVGWGFVDGVAEVPELPPGAVDISDV